MRRRNWCVGLLAGIAIGTITSPASAAAPLAGDCDGDGSVTISELITLVNIALGNTAIGACPAGDTDGDGKITISEIIAAVGNALCGGPCAPNVCGNGVLDPGEQCDPPFDTACPGACRPGAPPFWACISCAAATGTCSGPIDPSCAGSCVLQSTACTCAPLPPPECPAPQSLPPVSGGYDCPAACTQPGASLFYRDELVGTAEFTQYQIKLLDPVTGAVHVQRSTPSGTQDFDTHLEFGGGTGGIITPPGANAIFGGLLVYQQLFCGWPIGCGPDGTALIPNGSTYAFESNVGGGTTYSIRLSCAGCGGGADRVNASWQGARCGLETGLQVEKLCAGYNPYVPGSFAPRCCGCASDPICPASAPVCVGGTCM